MRCAPPGREAVWADAFGVAVREVCGEPGVEELVQGGSVAFDEASAGVEDVRGEGVGAWERAEADCCAMGVYR